MKSDRDDAEETSRKTWLDGVGEDMKRYGLS